MQKPKSSISAPEIFGQNLRRARRLKDVSQEELAFRASLSPTYVSEVERAARNISIDNMELLSIAIGMPLLDLPNPELFATVEDRIKSKK